MGSQGIIEENDLSELRGEYAPTHAFGIRLNTHERTHVHMHARTLVRTHAQYRGSIRDAYCDVYARLCAFTLERKYYGKSGLGDEEYGWENYLTRLCSD